VRLIQSPAALPDFSTLAEQFQQAVQIGRLDALAVELGLSVDSLARLGVGWSPAHNAWSFPMRDAGGRILGIRLRASGGRKYSVRGGKEGLFLPSNSAGNSLLVAEGPTDAAALLDMGFPFVVGRPSCTGGLKLLVELAGRHRANDVTVVADADEPGRRGSENLAVVLAVYVPAVRVIMPPEGIKDTREWLRRGGTRQEVEERAAAAPVRRLALQSRRADHAS
jgi:hypothetical protein